MKLSLPILTLCSLAANVAAFTDESLKGYTHLHFNVSRGNSFEDASSDKVPRLVRKADAAGSVTMELENQSTFYSVTLKIGSEEDKVIVLVDTGSSDLWVTGSDNLYCDSSSSSSSSTSTDSSKRFRKILNDKSEVDAFIHNSPGKYRKILNDKSEVDAIIHNNNAKFRKLDDASYHDAILLENSKDTYDEDEDEVEAEAVASKSLNNKGGIVTASTALSASLATIDCSTYGTFNKDDSTTWHSNDTEFFILYGDTTYAYGVWGYDTIKFDDISVVDFSFAVANQTNSSMGVLGIGLEGLETTYTGSLVNGNGYTYANLPRKMVEDGLINRRVYSLWLNDYESSSGSCLFGAIDKAKYNGTLSILPVLDTTGFDQPIKLQITLSSLKVSTSSSSKSVLTTEYPALLDSGTTLTYLPSDVISEIAIKVGATYSSDYGYYLLDCPTSDDVTFTYNFQGVEIDVPITDLVLQADTSGDTCVLAMLEDDDVILGDSFLRSAYVVYDLDNYQVALAQAVYTSSENIDVVTSTLPDATTAASYYYSYGATGATLVASSDNDTDSSDNSDADTASTTKATTTASGAGDSTYNVPSFLSVIISCSCALSLSLCVF